MTKSSLINVLYTVLTPVRMVLRIAVKYLSQALYIKNVNMLFFCVRPIY